mgnify:CR=1 FL=1
MIANEGIIYLKVNTLIPRFRAPRLLIYYFYCNFVNNLTNYLQNNLTAMTNKNKVTIIGTLNMFVLSMFLNSCQTEVNGHNMMKQENKPCKNGIHTYSDSIDANDAEQCPNCWIGSRYLYNVGNYKLGNRIVLICAECEAIWPDPKNIDWGGTISYKELKREGFLDGKTEHWATSEEANNSGWKELAQNNIELVK